MNDYRELRLDLNPCSEDATDILAAFLADIGFESFVPDTDGLTAYVKTELYDENALAEALSAFPLDARITRKVTTIEGRDWNSEWEKNYFKPIVVGERCVIHSSFHTDVPRAEYDIIIDPKMAFGTGHHATTSQVISALLEIDESGLTVTDMGTGTGILAILCSMRGATEVNGVEIDPAAWENAVENVALNGQENRVKLHLGDASVLPALPKADLFIANINRNIITGDLERYVAAMKPGASMILSGFYEHDIPIIMETAAKSGLTQTGYTVLNDWACLRLRLSEKNKK